MSSPIHSARCVRREDRAVEIELAPTGASGPHFPVSEFFAFALLHEAATDLVYSAPGQVVRRTSSLPIAALATGEELIDLATEPEAHPRRVALVRQCIVRADYCATRNWVPVLATRDATGVYRAPPKGPDPRLAAAYGALDAAFDAAVKHSRDPARFAAVVPSATLRIEVTDVKWCSHVEAPLIWDVYAFDDEARALI